MKNITNEDSKDIQDNRDWGAFIPSFLDEFGLDPFEFRLYSHIARRAGNGGKCWEKIDGIAVVCRMERKTAYRAFQFLEDHKLISVERRLGKTSIITLNHQSEWIPVGQEVESSRPSASTCPKNGTGKVSQKRNSTCAENGTPTCAKNGTPPVPKTVHKGSPSKLLPLEVTPSEVNPMKEEPYRATQKNSETILENLENSALPENSISEPKQEIEESRAAPPEIYTIAVIDKEIKKARPKKLKDENWRDKRELYAPFLEVWNQDRPERWTKHKVLGKEAIEKLNAFTQSYGDRSLEIFQKGLLYAQGDKFHRETVDWGMDEYLSNNKPYKNAEKYDHAHPENQTPMEESPDRQMSAKEKKMMDDYLRFKAVLMKKYEGKVA